MRSLQVDAGKLRIIAPERSTDGSIGSPDFTFQARKRGGSGLEMPGGRDDSSRINVFEKDDVAAHDANPSLLFRPIPGMTIGPESIWGRLNLKGRRRRPGRMARALLLAFFVLLSAYAASAGSDAPLFNDSHFHLTNYVQEGPSAERFLEIMGTAVGRSTLFGIPLQQTWSHSNSGDSAPTYYLHSDAPLYYYSFTDAQIAMEYRKLKPEQQARFDPMITGFNPADMYAADHIRRVLTIFPGVFSGIGEFTIHKEFVSSKLAGGPASLADPAIDRIFALAAETGLVVLLHNDIDVPFAKQGAAPAYLGQLKDALRRHPEATIIWAHVGLGRVIHPVQPQAGAPPSERNPRHREIIAAILEDPGLRHVLLDLSWDEVAKYLLSTPEATQATAELINAHPDRFLFGTDNVAPPDQATHLAIYHSYAPLWKRLTPAARRQVLFLNYERVFDAARARVRAWERSQAGRPPS